MLTILRCASFIAFVLILTGLAIIKDSATGHFGRDVVTAFFLGFLAGCVLYQVAHKLRYGHWFEPPD
jgi:uncharacterized membrane protein YozB (DUF420 family)